MALFAMLALPDAGKLDGVKARKAPWAAPLSPPLPAPAPAPALVPSAPSEGRQALPSAPLDLRLFLRPVEKRSTISASPGGHACCVGRASASSSRRVCFTPVPVV